jgi:hypothetical protein
LKILKFGDDIIKFLFLLYQIKFKTLIDKAKHQGLQQIISKYFAEEELLMWMFTDAIKKKNTRHLFWILVFEDYTYQDKAYYWSRTNNFTTYTYLLFNLKLLEIKKDPQSFGNGNWFWISNSSDIYDGCKVYSGRTMRDELFKQTSHIMQIKYSP